MFSVGQQVACIRDSWEAVVPGRSAPYIAPVRGRVYTIEEIEAHFGSDYLVLLECSPEDCFAAERFRPLNKTDISVFTAMLNRQPELVS